MESEEGFEIQQADINVQNMSKIFSNGQKVVDNLSFRAYRGQVIRD